MIPFNNYWMITEAALARVVTVFKGIALSDVDEAKRMGLPVRMANGVAIIDMKGTMVKDAGFLTFFGFVGTNDIKQAFRSALSDPEAKQIVFNIDSGGGSVDGLAELGDEIFAARGIKPIIAQVNGMAASAAYYIASQADVIYAGRNDVVGSIGVRLLIEDSSEYFSMLGVKIIPIVTGEHKAAGAQGLEVTDSQIAEFQRIVDEYFGDFKAVVMRGRGMTDKQVMEVADGRVFIGAANVQNGLVDGIQTIDATVGLLMQENIANEETGRRSLIASRLKLDI